MGDVRFVSGVEMRHDEYDRAFSVACAPPLLVPNGGKSQTLWCQITYLTKRTWNRSRHKDDGFFLQYHTPTYSSSHKLSTSQMGVAKKTSVTFHDDSKEEPLIYHNLLRISCSSFRQNLFFRSTSLPHPWSYMQMLLSIHDGALVSHPLLRMAFASLSTSTRPALMRFCIGNEVNC